MKIDFDKAKKDSPNLQFYQLESLINKNIMPKSQFDSMKKEFNNGVNRDHEMNEIVLTYNKNIDELKSHFKGIEQYTDHIKRTEGKITTEDGYRKNLSNHIQNNAKDYIKTSKNEAITKENVSLQQKSIPLKDDNVHAFSDKFKEMMK